MKQIENLIIGCGPAGLAMAGVLSQQKVEYTIVEQSSNIANTWHQHYDRLSLHTVKELSHLPGMPFPKDYPRYVPRKMLLEYYQQYAKQNNIEPILNTEIKQVKSINENWLVETATGENYQCKNVIFATGTNRSPIIPTWQGQETFTGDIIHSRYYKNSTPYQSQKVLVVGMGNTGAEIALDLAENNVDVSVCVRSPLNIVPRDLFGRPTQLTGKLLDKLPFGDWLGALTAKLVYGDLSKYGISRSKTFPSAQLREQGRTPTIDLGTVAKIKEGKIKVLPDIEQLSNNGVHFNNGDTINFDSIILATGYKAKVEDLIENGNELIDNLGFPKKPIATAQHKGLFFIGFDVYKLGGIFGTIGNEAELIQKAIT